MPKLWNETIAGHRRAVGDAILDSAAALVAERGPLSVTMSQIAERVGIGRATLYKYFSDVEGILLAWHERQVIGHLEQLAKIRDRPGKAGERLRAVLEAYALISHEHHGTELVALLHRGAHVDRAQRQLSRFIRDLLAEGAETGVLRNDVAPDELASYCLHALSAASAMPSKAAVCRLVSVTLTGLDSRAEAVDLSAAQGTAIQNHAHTVVPGSLIGDMRRSTGHPDEGSPGSGSDPGRRPAIRAAAHRT